MVNNTEANSQLANISSRFPSNSEANASELLGNLEELFPLYYMHSDVAKGLICISVNVLFMYMLQNVEKIRKK